VKYAAEGSWLIARGGVLWGRATSLGFDQYRELCDRVVMSTDYRGAPYSWGDAYIAECAGGEVGTGNLRTWVSVATNVHLTGTIGFLASHFGTGS
jgi:hypothetical protein